MNIKKFKPKVIFAITYALDEKFWLKNELQKIGYNVKLLSTKDNNKNASLSHWSMIKSNFTSLKLAIKVYREYENEEIVIFWTYLAGVLFAILDLIKRKTTVHTRILALHMLVINPNIFKKFFIRLVSFFSSRNNRLIIAVNSEEEKITFSTKYYINIEKTFVVPDCIETMRFHEFKNGDGRIFCGGDNSRDWATFLEAARILPHIQFIGIARKRNFDSSQIIPSNCLMYFDTDKEFFYKTLYDCSLVVLPLSSNLASGLLVLGQSAAFCKPVIITETSCSVNYVENMKTGLLLKEMKVPDELANAINTLINDKELQYDLATSFSENMKINHSHSRYASKLVSILK